MPAEEGKDLLSQALTLGGGGIALTALGAFIRGLFNGTSGQEKELRTEYREELNRLRTVQEAQQTEIDELRNDVRRLTEMNLYLLTTRAEARAELSTLQRQQGLTVTTWPPDPTYGGAP